MSPIAIAIVTLAAATPQSFADSAQPTPLDLGVALTLERFDDRCAGPGPDDACPMINIYRVQVRKQHCRPANAAELVPVNVKVIRALVCRFESNVTTSARTFKAGSGHWHEDQALMYFTANGWSTASYVADRF
nr:hypothetical protein [uncultured Sphingomonas sp.]